MYQFGLRTGRKSGSCLRKEWFKEVGNQNYGLRFAGHFSEREIPMKSLTAIF